MSTAEIFTPVNLTNSASQTQDLMILICDFVHELHPQRPRTDEVLLQDTLDRDLGIDSLGRAELLLRIEHAFGIRLPPGTISEAQTVGDLLAAVQKGAPRRGPTQMAVPPPIPLPLVPAAADAQTLTEVLDWHVERHPDRLHATILEDEETVLATLTYAQLATAARRVAVGLVIRDVAPGDRVALMLPTGSDFFAAFFGVLYAGAIPVPIYPPARLTQIEEHMRRQVGILRNAAPRILITVPEALRLGSIMEGQVETLTTIESVANLSVPANAQLPPFSDGRATAFLQYTSGSTGDPKGVVLSHANMLANIRALGIAIEANSSDIFLSWLPLYHDFGLVAAWLGSLYFAVPLFVMSPLSFLARPESWLRAIHRYRATLSAAPNFAFELCVDKVEAADIEGVDLGSLRLMANGAEPVSAQTLRRFTQRFRPYGFRPEAMRPAYGLAESAVGLTLSPLGHVPLIDRVNRDALSRRGVAESAKPDDAEALEIVSCGLPLPGHEVRIVDETDRELGERREGRLEFRGPSATSGYFHNPIKTQELFHGAWLDSGDQAYMAEGEVYLTGRIKDIIIRAGHHIYPQEIEEAIAGLSGVVRNGVAAFGTTDQSSGTERVVVLIETTETDLTARKALQALAQEVVTDIIGAPPDEVVLAPPQTVPKTSSGKIRRSAARGLYESGDIGSPQRSIRWQMLRLFLSGLVARCSHLPRLLGEFIYAMWWWSVIAAAAVPCCLAVMILPKLEWRWTIVRSLARAALAAVGTPVSITGAEYLPAGRAVVAFNHSSYADALVVAATLPGAPIFAAKKEFARQVFVGSFLRRLGVFFVERYDIAASLADAEAATSIARQGRLLVFFPEGTFTRRAGLTEFYLGAFNVATEAGLPVIPGVIHGTRSMLRADQWFPRWAPISVYIGESVQPSGSDFTSVLQLRSKVRDVILQHCGEPDLGELAKPILPPDLRPGRKRPIL
jgi:1-acyl-sn-glycerol-3-phosphate acyltransferase